MSKKKKIGLVLAATPAYSETFFNSKIKGLQEAGHKVVLFVNSKNTSHLDIEIVKAPELANNKVKNIVLSLFILLKLLLLNFASVKKNYQLDKEDGLSFKKRVQSLIINSHILKYKLDWLHFGFGTLALNRENVAQAIGAKMAVSFRGFDHYVYPVKNLNCYTILFKKEVKYHVLSDGMKKDLILEGIDEKQVVKITPAIDLSLFKIAEERKKERNRIVTIARLHWIKGLEYTLQALALVKQKGINFEYCIIGEGVDQERLKFAVYQLNLQENVFFLGKLNPMEVKEELSKSSIYLQYSLQEGFCNAVLEAQAMELLCIVSDAEGLSENILDEETGFVVKKRKPEAFARVIVQTINFSDVEKKVITAAAKNRVNEVFSVEKQIQSFLSFYK
ncbi:MULTISPECIES: glycosyltransferase family 4 protein [Flavobacterium]|uniref:Glycosyltransferase family 4 protein n=1 Tax=Flavobacterium jumunjinense TaxID=998845 RepID=A0ABV5GJ28_9FLAO|nr:MULTISPECIES: glycosyltransferase family 4 protein [Flavobacterium]